MSRKLTAKERLAWGAVSAVAFLAVYLIVVPFLFRMLAPVQIDRISGSPAEPILDVFLLPLRFVYDSSETYAEFVKWASQK